MACLTQRLRGNPGDPGVAPLDGESPNNRNREKGLIGGRESDYLIVPMKAGNAAGGKEVTCVHAGQGHTGRAQSRKTVLTKLARIVRKETSKRRNVWGAVCVNSASTVLRGGCPARGTSTRRRMGDMGG